MVKNKDLGEVQEVLEDHMDDVSEEIKQTLSETQTRKELFFGVAIVVSVIAVSIIMKDPYYMVAAVAGALGFWILYKVVG